jgi:UDP-glucose 4-epimerase
MKISGGYFVITGGASLIGSHIAEQLLAKDAASVILFDNFSLGAPETVSFLTKNPKVKLVRGDILRVNELNDVFENVQGIFAVAAFLTLPLSQNPWLGLDVNIRGMQNVLDACRTRGVKKIVFSSSVAVYGQTDPGIAEDVPLFWQSLQPAGALYAGSKMLGENLCRYYEKLYGIDYVALRYSTVYGERQHYRGVNALYIIEAYDQIVVGKPPVLPGDGSEVHDYVYVGDVARANVMAMQSDLSGESFNIVSGVDTSLNEIVNILLRLTGSNLRPVYHDDPSKVRFTTTSKIDYKREKAKRLLGWQPETNVEQGIARLVAWLKEKKS